MLENASVNASTVFANHFIFGVAGCFFTIALKAVGFLLYLWSTAF